MGGILCLRTVSLKKSLAITLLILMFSTVVFAANGIYDKKTYGYSW